MRTLRFGDTGDDVKELQRALNKSGHGLKVDGEFGESTEAAVEAFQAAHHAYADGVVGPVTWELLQFPEYVDTEQNVWKTVLTFSSDDKHYDRFSVRDDVAVVLKDVVDELFKTYGVRLTSSGGKRVITTPASSNQSSTSLHYLGRAIDIGVYSAMADPKRDPYVVTRDPESPRHWVVWARTDNAPVVTLQAVTYEKSGKEEYPQKIVEVTGSFMNLTEFLDKKGFKRIPMRKAFLHKTVKTNGAAEWWHFQYEEGLVPGETTFGSELLRLYSTAELAGTPPWKHRDLKWKEGWG